jgi:hypothetical protein
LDFFGNHFSNYIFFISSFMLSWLRIGFHNLFRLLSIMFFRSHDSGDGFSKLTRVDFIFFKLGFVLFFHLLSMILLWFNDLDLGLTSCPRLTRFIFLSHFFNNFFSILPSNNSIFLFFLVFFSISSILGCLRIEICIFLTCFLWSYLCLVDLVFLLFISTINIEYIRN